MTHQRDLRRRSQFAGGSAAALLGLLLAACASGANDAGSPDPTTGPEPKSGPEPNVEGSVAAARAVPPEIVDLTDACEKNDFRACHELGVAYADGERVSVDEPRATALYRKSCEGGYAHGCYEWGTSHYSGVGIPKNEARGIEFYRRACAFARGAGVAKDPKRAQTFREKACLLEEEGSCEPPAQK